MNKEQILELVQEYFKVGGIRDDGSSSEYYGSLDDFVKFAEKIYCEVKVDVYQEGRWDGYKERDRMTSEQQELLNDFREEVEKCFEIAQKLDSLNPNLTGTFTGTPSERIKRHLYLHGIFK